MLLLNIKNKHHNNSNIKYKNICNFLYRLDVDSMKTPNVLNRKLLCYYYFDSICKVKNNMYFWILASHYICIPNIRGRGNLVLRHSVPH